jgi:HK97 family phage major capsid protein
VSTNLDSVTRDLTEAREKHSRNVDELMDILAGTNNGPGSRQRFDDLTRAAEKTRARVVALEAERDRLDVDNDAAIAEIKRYAAMPGHVEVPAAPPESFNVNRGRHSDPWSHVRDGSATPSDIRDRALSAVERVRLDTADVAEDDTRQRVTQLLENGENTDLAEYVTVVSQPAYGSVFKKLLRNPATAAMSMSDSERAAFNATQTPKMRAAMSETAANGGYLVPFHLDPSIVLSSNGSKNPFRSIARVETITSNVWHGVSSAGVTAEWTAEAAEWTDASPTFAQPTITTYKADAYLQSSFELAQDSSIDAQIGMLLSDAKANLEATAFATGSGTNQPWGLISRLAATTASRVSAQTNAAFGSIDVFGVDNARPARHRDGAAWLAHWSIYNLVRQFTAAQSSTAFWVDLGPGVPSTLLGPSTFESSAMEDAPLSAATASSDKHPRARRLQPVRRR